MGRGRRSLRQNLAPATRNPATLGTSPDGILAAQIGWTGLCPWVGIGIRDEHLPSGYWAPEAVTVSTPGASTYTLPPWFEIGRDWLTVVAIGAGGGSSSIVAPGGDGGSTTFTQGTTRTALGGAGGAAGTTGDPVGASPGNHTANASRFFGGTQAGHRKAGAAPGGGAGGGGGWPLFTKPGSAGQWYSEKFKPTSGTVTFSVGAGGDSEPVGVGPGGHGRIWFIAERGLAAVRRS